MNWLGDERRGLRGKTVDVSELILMLDREMSRCCWTRALI